MGMSEARAVLASPRFAQAGQRISPAPAHARSKAPRPRGAKAPLAHERRSMGFKTMLPMNSPGQQGFALRMAASFDRPTPREIARHRVAACPDTPPKAGARSPVAGRQTQLGKVIRQERVPERLRVTNGVMALLICKSMSNYPNKSFITPLAGLPHNEQGAEIHLVPIAVIGRVARLETCHRTNSHLGRRSVRASGFLEGSYRPTAAIYTSELSKAGH